MRIFFFLLFLLRPITSNEEDQQNEILNKIDTNDTLTKDPSSCELDYTSHQRRAKLLLLDDVESGVQRLVEPFKNAISYIEDEKEHLIDIMRYSVMYDVKRHFNALLEYTDFAYQLDAFLEAIFNILKSDKKPTLSNIKQEISNSLNELLTHVIPSTFLCVSLGKCRTVPIEYQKCMMRESSHWSKFVGESPSKMATIISEAIYRYRRTQILLIDLQKQLQNSSNQIITTNCVNSFVNLTISDSIDCKETIKQCYGAFNSEWNAKLQQISNLTNSQPFAAQFLYLRRGLVGGIRYFVERKAPAFASRISSTCGHLGHMWIHPEKRIIPLKRPSTFRSRAEQTVKELHLSIIVWNKLAKNMCDIELPIECASNSTGVSHDGIPVFKDVRPKEMIRQEETRAMLRESSGNALIDDEDGDDFIIESSGSGMPPPIIETVPSTHIIREHPKNIEVTRNDPTIVINDIREDEPDSCCTIPSIIALAASLVFMYW